MRLFRGFVMTDETEIAAAREEGRREGLREAAEIARALPLVPTGEFRGTTSEDGYQVYREPTRAEIAAAIEARIASPTVEHQSKGSNYGKE